MTEIIDSSKNNDLLLDNNITQCVIFKLNNESYCIDVMKVQEVLRYSEIASVPGASDYILGIINLRGSVVTVIDSKIRFGVDNSSEIDDFSRIIIIEIQDQVVGLLVDNVSEVVNIDMNNIEPAPNIKDDDSSLFIKGIYNQENELLIIVDLDKLFINKELDALC